MAGNTGYGADGIGALGVFEIEILFVDISRHAHHVAGYFLFRFFIAAKIELGGVCGAGRMAKAALHPQRYFELVHNGIETVAADVLGQHFQVSFAGLLVRMVSSYTQYYTPAERERNEDFFAVDSEHSIGLEWEIKGKCYSMTKL